MDIQEEREDFINETRNLDSFNFYEFSVYPFEFNEDTEMFYFPPTQLLWEAWQAAKAQAVPEWIEYKKQSPRIDGRYQIFINGEKLAADWESPYGFSSAEDGTAFIQELITHWSVLTNDPVVKAQEQSHV